MCIIHDNDYEVIHWRWNQLHFIYWRTP